MSFRKFLNEELTTKSHNNLEDWKAHAEKKGYAVHNDKHFPNHWVAHLTGTTEKKGTPYGSHSRGHFDTKTGSGMIHESISQDAPASDYIKDFVHSKSKTFKGDSKKQRIKRALGAYYHREETVTEGLRLTATHSNGDRTAKVYRDHEWEEHRVKHFVGGVHQHKADYHTQDKEEAHSHAKQWAEKTGVHAVKEEKMIDEGIKNHQRFNIKNEYRHIYTHTHHTGLKADTQPYKKPGDAHSTLQMSPGNGVGGAIEVPSHHLEHVKEEVVTEKVADNKEALEKAIAAAERKAAKSASKKESSYLEMLKKAYRRIKGRTNVRNDEIGVAEQVSAAPQFQFVTELSKTTLGSYRKKAIGQLKAGKGELKGKEIKRFNGVGKSLKEDEGTEYFNEELGPEHHAALKRYAAANGRTWKTKLNTDWEKGHTHGDDTANIRQVRNLIGPSGLQKYKLQKEDVSEGKTLKPHDARRVFDKYNARHQADAEAHAATPAGRAERDARNKAMLAKVREDASDAELDAIYEADVAFHDQDEFTKHAHKNGHHVRTVLRGTNAHLHAKNLGTGKTHGLFDVKKSFGAYSHGPLHVEEMFEGDFLVGSGHINEEMSAEAHELVLHADNDRHLHHGSHQPIIKNLKKKAKSGKYDPEKAKKLWGYHADRAAQSYHKQHGSGGKWHHMFTPEHRKQAAAHWEAHHRSEVHEE